MNICVVGEQKLVDAFELIGVRGHVVEADAALEPLVRELARREKVVLLLVQSELATALSDELLDSLARESGCLVLEIPGVNRPAPDPNLLRKKLQSLVGAAM